MQIGRNAWYDPMHGVPAVGPPRLCKCGTEDEEVSLWRMRLDDLCIRWIMSYGHYYRRWFLKSLWSETFLSTWVLISMVMVLWAFFNSHKPTSENRAYCMRQSTRLFLPMEAGDVKNSKLISCTWTQFLHLDSGRQEEFSLLSAEAVASNAHYSQPSVEVAEECGIFENLL